jgi:hypothetical protein
MAEKEKLEKRICIKSNPFKIKNPLKQNSQYQCKKKKKKRSKKQKQLH